MEIILVLVTSLYAALFGWFWFKWPKPDPAKDQEAGTRRPTDVTVLIPVRNEEKYLEKTVLSVLAQSLRPTEWIIVDDGSSYQTPQIIKKLENASTVWL